jgi:predicted signal transduction protein with EAL and GGDEF domain
LGLVCASEFANPILWRDWGGDEFAIVLGHVRDEQECTATARELLAELEIPFLIEDHKIATSASIGISFFPENAATGAELLQRADVAMHAAKRKGKNAVRGYTPELGLQANERLALETELRSAVKDGKIAVHYQPEFELASNRLVRFEALARWFHPTLGSVPPSKFIPVAEETGIIGPLGASVMQQACTEAVKWQSLAPYPVQVAVNVSSLQFTQESFVDELTRVLESSGLTPNLLQIEITESVMLGDPGFAADVMTRVNELGIHLAIDDFGTGYSCLSSLPRFPVESIKIDQSFLRDFMAGGEFRAMLSSLISLAHDLGRRVVVEGVERVEQLELIRALGADEVQGFLLGRPTTNPASKLLRHLYSHPPALAAPQLNTSNSTTEASGLQLRDNL